MKSNVLRDKYFEVFDDYKKGKIKEKNPFESDTLIDILKRGICICDNDNVKPADNNTLVLCGINPSGKGGDNEKYVCQFHFNDAQDSGKSDYWKIKHNQFGGKCSNFVQEHIAYFDLLPLINTKQNEVESYFKEYNAFRFDLVKKTAEAIEDIKPKLIIHANNGSLYYWGLNPRSYTQDLKKPWLGYSFKEVTLECPVLVSYKENLDQYKRNNPNQHFSKEYVHLYEISGNGLNTTTYFMSYIMENYSFKPWQKEQKLTEKQMLEIFQWCCIKANER